MPGIYILGRLSLLPPYGLGIILFTMFESQDNYDAVFREMIATTPEEETQFLGENEAFNKALEVAFVLTGDRVEKSDLKKYKSEHSPLITELNAMLKAAGLIEKQVVIEGENIKKPYVVPDLSTTTLTIKGLEAHKGVIQPGVEPYKQYGAFSGFSLDFKKTPDEKKYIPVLIYRVKAGVAFSSNSTSQLYATGVVGVDSLRFVEDIQRAESIEFSRMLELLIPEAEESIRKITSLLSHEDLSVDDIHDISYLASSVVSEVLDEELIEKVESLLISLIRTRINSNAKYRIRTPDKVTVQSEDHLDLQFDTSSENPFTIEGPIKDILFKPKVRYTKNGLKQSQDKVLHIITSKENDSSIYVAFKDIIEFEQK